MQKTLIEHMEPVLRRGIDKAMQLGASAAKLSFSHSESVGCEFESGRLKSSGSQESVNCGIVVVVKGRSVSTGGNRIENIEPMVEHAVNLAAAGSNAHFDSYPAPEKITRVDGYCPHTASMDREAMIEACQRIVSPLKQLDPDLDINAGCSRSEAESLVLTSGGVCHSSRTTRWGLGGGVQRTRGTDMLFAHAGRSWRKLNEFFDPEYIENRIEEDLRLAEELSTAPTGPITMVMPPEAVGYILGPTLSGLNGRNVCKGTSPLRDHLGEAFFDSKLTIVDKPHIPFSTSIAEIDSAGIPTRESTLIEDGIIRMFLYDLDTAGMADATPTGHSGCRPYNPRITPGAIHSSDMIADIEDGIYVKALLGFGQSNIANGDFSANVALGYRIKNGKFIGRVKNTMLAGNLFDLLKADVGISSDTDPVSELPYVTLKGVIASTSQG